MFQGAIKSYCNMEIVADILWLVTYVGWSLESTSWMMEGVLYCVWPLSCLTHFTEINQCQYYTQITVTSVDKSSVLQHFRPQCQCQIDFH